MNLFFDELSQAIILDAKKEMYDLKHPYVGSEHLFLSILKHSDLDITKVLNSYGISYDQFRKELVSVIGYGSQNNDWFLFTPLLRNILNHASYYSESSDKIITPKCLLISILQEGDGVAARILTSMNVDIIALYEKFLNFSDSQSSFTLLNQYGINLNEKSMSDSYDPVIGRDDKIMQIIQILLRKNKNNPLLIGEAGVGKTAIVEELAHRIAIGDVPYKMKDKMIYSVAMSSLVAGTKYRGEFEEKIQNLIHEVENHPNIILFIDEIHTMIGAGGAEGAIDASNILKPYLARGNIKLIGATTIKEYQDTILKDKAFNRRFQTIVISEANKNEVLQIMKQIKPIYEEYHNVSISEYILEKVVDLSFSCVFKGRQPDRTIDFLDEICSYSVIHHNLYQDKESDIQRKIQELEAKKNEEILKNNFVKASYYKNKELKYRNQYNLNLLNSDIYKRISISEKDIFQILYERTGGLSNKQIRSRLRLNEKKINYEVLGQENVIKKVWKILKKYDYIQNNRCLSFLFVGKSGVGKTFLVDKIYKLLFEDCNYVRINMSEFRDENSLCKLIGSNHSYDEYYHNYYFQCLQDYPFSIILLDHIDKAHPAIIRFILKMIQDGYYMNGLGEKVIVSKCIIFMTATNHYSLGFHSLSSNPIEVENVLMFNDLNESIIYDLLDKKIHKYDSNSNKKKNYLLKLIKKVDWQKNGFHAFRSFLS